jgi:uncharacterized protein (UPF0264 family)
LQRNRLSLDVPLAMGVRMKQSPAAAQLPHGRTKECKMENAAHAAIFSGSSDRPGLLVSVRSAAEARTALGGGADVIDVKEPSRGSLGAADLSTIRAVVRAVAGRAPVSAAAGELGDWPTAAWPRPVPAGVTLVKLGLAACGPIADWPTRWRDAIAALAGAARPVAVAYADWRAAEAPDPRHVLAEAVAIGCPALLVDTWDKSSGTLLDHWPLDELGQFVSQVHDQHIAPVLAGSLAGSTLLAAARLGPRLIAVRGAVCEAGRGSTISLASVQAVASALATGRLVQATPM